MDKMVSLGSLSNTGRYYSVEGAAERGTTTRWEGIENERGEEGQTAPSRSASASTSKGAVPLARRKDLSRSVELMDNPTFNRDLSDVGNPMSYSRRRMRQPTSSSSPGTAKVSRLLRIARLRGLDTIRQADRAEWGEDDLKVTPRAVAMELKWVKDPRALAERVGVMLSCKFTLLAAELVRKAQKSGMECGAAWNYLQQYCMYHGEPLAALAFYNDVSSRAIYRTCSCGSWVVPSSYICRVSCD